MSTQHLSDEAVAAFADGLLRGHARDRAARHTAACPECAHAVAVQREAVWALRAAPAPGLPSGLLDRLRAVPSTTPLNVAPAALGPDGAALFAAPGAAPPVPPDPAEHTHRVHPLVFTAAAVAAAGVLAVGSTTSHGAARPLPVPAGSAQPGAPVLTPVANPAALHGSPPR